MKVRLKNLMFWKISIKLRFLGKSFYLLIKAVLTHHIYWCARQGKIWWNANLEIYHVINRSRSKTLTLREQCPQKHLTVQHPLQSPILNLYWVYLEEFERSIQISEMRATIKFFGENIIVYSSNGCNCKLSVVPRNIKNSKLYS